MKETFFSLIFPFNPFSDQEFLIFYSQHNAGNIFVFQSLGKVAGSRDLKTDTKEGPDGF